MPNPPPWSITTLITAAYTPVVNHHIGLAATTPPTHLNFRSSRGGKRSFHVSEQDSICNLALGFLSSDLRPRSVLSLLRTRVLSVRRTRVLSLRSQTRAISALHTRAISALKMRAISASQTRAISASHTRAISALKTRAISVSQTRAISASHTRAISVSQMRAISGIVHFTYNDLEFEGFVINENSLFRCSYLCMTVGMPPCPRASVARPFGDLVMMHSGLKS